MPTIKEALQAAVMHPLEDAQLSKILIDRGLSETDPYTGKTQAFDLATADAIVLLITAPDLGEGEFSRRLANKELLINIASGIYIKYGEVNPLVTPPKITAIQTW